MNYPKRWQSLFAYHQQKMAEGVFSIFNPEDTSQTFGILLLPEQKSRDEVMNQLKHSLATLPSTLQNKLLIQENEHVHFSLQWSDKRKIKGSKREELLSQLVALFKDFSVISGELYFPFLGVSNLYGLVKTEQIDPYTEYRSKIGQVFEPLNIKMGIPEEDYDLIHTSLVRFLQPLTDHERMLLQEVSVHTIPLSLNCLVITFNDKLMRSKYTEVLYEQDLLN